MVRRGVGVLLISSLVAIFVGCGGKEGSSAEALRVGLVPNENPDEVEAQYEPLQEYLSGELDREVELFVPTDYSAVVEAMVSGELDLAYFGGLTYAQARERADAGDREVVERGGEAYDERTHGLSNEGHAALLPDMFSTASPWWATPRRARGAFFDAVCPPHRQREPGPGRR